MDNLNYLPDIYNITSTISEIQKKYIEEDETTLALGIYGYLNEVNANMLQNSIYLAAEYGNEALPVRSKFERTILTNAITYDIQDINAKPAKMTAMIGFLKSSIDNYLDKNEKFVLDRYSTIAIEQYEFHIDYDIIIERDTLLNKKVVYTARYDLSYENTLSDIINPYLRSPMVTNIQGDDYLFIICDIQQTSLAIESNRVITNNILESKTFDFDFENQLCTFNVFVTENGVKTELKPIYEGLPSTTEKFCYYTYIDQNTIRVKFDRESYQPALNCEIEVEVYTTLGSSGNFEYDKTILLPLQSDRFEYKNIKAILKPMTSSVDGSDKKSVEYLKKIIPKKMLARAGIINTKDLQNYFDMIDVDNRLIVFKKRDNQIERLYYAYLLAKDQDSNITPTNTININLNSEDFDVIYDDRYVLKPGRKIYYDKNMVGYYDQSRLPNNQELKPCDCGCGCLMSYETPVFTYSSPFITIINKQPLSISYYLDIINRSYVFTYDYINQKSVLQFISNGLNMYKNYLYEDNYVFTLNVTQNIDANDVLVTYEKDEEGNETDIIDKIFMTPVLTITSNNKTYYMIGEIVSYDENASNFGIEFRMESNNSLINKKNEIQILNLTENGEEEAKPVFINDKVDVGVLIFVDNSIDYVDSDSTYEQDIQIPSLKKTHVLVNKYTIKEDVYLFYNYSSTINSVCEVNYENTETELDESYNFTMYSIPLIRHDYINDIDRLDEFISYLQYRKAYIDKAQDVLEDSFNVDLKFFNTYGPSKLFHIGRNPEILDRTNLTLNFIVKLDVIGNYDVIYEIQDSIKEYIENINTLTNIHMSNICSYIKQKYDNDIDYIEFEGINHYNSNYQYIERLEPDILEDVPEFINVNLNDLMEPDINITVI